jgi:hypothetical protein
LRSKICRAKTTFDVFSKKTGAEKERCGSKNCLKVVFEAYSANESDPICSKYPSMEPFFEQNEYLALPFLSLVRQIPSHSAKNWFQSQNASKSLSLPHSIRRVKALVVWDWMKSNPKPQALLLS